MNGYTPYNPEEDASPVTRAFHRFKKEPATFQDLVDEGVLEEVSVRWVRKRLIKDWGVLEPFAKRPAGGMRKGPGGGRPSIVWRVKKQ